MNPTPDLSAAVAVLAGVPRTVDAYRGVSDAVLLQLMEVAGQVRRLADAHVALIAGELARRSDPALGGAGLVRRAGARTTEELLRTVTGATGRDAVVAVRVGKLTQDGDALGVGGVLGVAVTAGVVSVPAAEAIRAGLDGAAADPILVAEATELLCLEAQSTDPTGC